MLRIDFLLETELNGSRLAVLCRERMKEPLMVELCLLALLDPLRAAWEADAELIALLPLLMEGDRSDACASPVPWTSVTPTVA